jgi:hypothetical protein
MTGDIMKRAELIIGKTYFMSESANWRDKHSGGNSHYQTAQRNRWRKVTIIETQLKTEHQKMYRTRDVLIQNYEGVEKWVSLNHIRCEWAYAIGLMTQDHRRRYDSPDEGRGAKYRRHLERKIDREQYKPALKQMLDTINELTGESVWSHNRIESGFSIEQIKTINEALSLLKTQKPALLAVAS